ncbi:hypothetical protein HDU97_008808 [Phlyctochytrium planicorne]|nr:hypothetical protein HDU97_008808 [Phlyctochytrium planicorne]
MSLAAMTMILRKRTRISYASMHKGQALGTKVGSILTNIPSMLRPKETAYEGFEISEFPDLTETFTLLPYDVDPSTITLSAISWLVKFQPEIFWRGEAISSKSLQLKGG